MKTEIFPGNPPGIKNPPDKCPHCHSKRHGIQEGEIIFHCGTTLDFREAAKTKIFKTRRSSKCRMIG